jgi:hypothetical protein
MLWNSYVPSINFDVRYRDKPFYNQLGLLAQRHSCSVREV